MTVLITWECNNKEDKDEYESSSIYQGESK